MFQKERYEQIYNILKERQSATVQYLQKRLYVSEATVRRDLEVMEQTGAIQRVWGGAMLPALDKDIPSFVRDKTNNDKKEKIAEIASRLVPNSASIFIDSSTTCHRLVPYLAERRQLVIITSSLQLGQLLTKNTAVSLNLLGGNVFEGNILTGHAAVASVRQYHADIMFFSCSGITSQEGVSSIEARVVEVVQEMMRRSGKRVLLCDSSKVGKHFLWTLADLDALDCVIMDKVPEDAALVNALGERLITNAKQLK
jgi:DeoR/GlpR family transcriptional regulator of sugar metabolism